MLPSAQGHGGGHCGYMTESIIAFTRFAFDRLGATRIRALHADWNRASRRVLEEAGFQFIEHIPQGFQKHGRWISEDLLVLLPFALADTGLQKEGGNSAA